MQYRVYLDHGSTNYLEKLYQIGDLELNIECRYLGKLWYMGDSSDKDRVKLRTAQEELRFVFRSKIDNPKWLEGMKQHGFRGAQELSTLTDYMIGWDSTSDIVDDWMYKHVAENFLFDDDTREWIEDENPYAMMAMLNRLFEAIDRGYWDADPDMIDRLRDLYLDAEERIEEITDR